MLIRRLEEREAETGRSLTEQAESNRQLKLKIDELRKHLEEKANSIMGHTHTHTHTHKGNDTGCGTNPFFISSPITLQFLGLHR